MALNDKRSIIDAHLKVINESERSSKGVILAASLAGLAAASIIGFMAFTPSSNLSTELPNKNPIEIERTEIAIPVLASEKEEAKKMDIVAVITPTKEQMKKLEGEEEGKAIIKKNKKRKAAKAAKAAKVIESAEVEDSYGEIVELELTQEEIMLLEEADILGTEGQIIKESELEMVQENTLPVPFNNPAVGISDKTYKADEVKHLHMVTTGYVEKRYSSKPKVEKRDGGTH